MTTQGRKRDKEKMEARDPFCFHFPPFNIASLREHSLRLSMRHSQRAMSRIFCLHDRNGDGAIMSSLRVITLSELVIYFTCWLTKSFYRIISPAKNRKSGRSRSPAESSSQAQDWCSGETEQKCKKAKERKKEKEGKKEGKKGRVRVRKGEREEERQKEAEYKKGRK